MYVLVAQSCLTLNTRVGCHALLQGSSQPRDQTRISCVAGGFFTTEPLGKHMGIMISSLFCRCGQTLKFTWEEKGATTTNKYNTKEEEQRWRSHNIQFQDLP